MDSSTFGQTISQAIGDSWAQIITFIPDLIGAIVILLLGILVAWALKWIVTKFFEVIKIQTLAKQVKLVELLEKIKVSQNVPQIFGGFVYWIVIIVFLLPALQTLGLNKVSDVLYQILNYIPNALVAAFMVLVGVLLSDFVGHVVKAAATSFGSTTAGVLSSIVRYAIIVFVILAAIVQLGVAVYFLNALFTGFVAMVAIAGGLAFGLGGKDAAKELLENLKEDFTIKK